MPSISTLTGTALVSLLLTTVAVPAQRPDSGPGKALFEGSGCLTCHTVDGRGGRFGPDLSWIGLLRSAPALRESLVDPGAHIDRNFFTLVIVPADGPPIEGLALYEDDASIAIGDKPGARQLFLKTDLKDLRREERSLMPSYAAKLTASEIDQLVAYLGTLRSIPPIEPHDRTRAIAPPSLNAEFFNRPDRDAEERTDALIAALPIRDGSRVADVGAGTGYFTWRLAQRAGPAGRVTAVDIQQQMLDRTAETVRRHQLSNVDYVLGSDSNPRLPEGSFDIVFIAYSYHEFAQPETILAAVRRALKPDGRLVILEYAKESPLAPASPLHTMSFEEIRSEVEPQGFELDRILDFLPMQHGLIFAGR